MLSFAPLARATTVTVPALQGKPGSSSFGQWSCFSEYYGGIIGTSATGCSSSTVWETPLEITTTGSKTVTMYAYQYSTADTVQCNVVGTATDGASASSSGYVYSNSIGSTSFTGTATVPSNGVLLVECQLTEGGLYGTTNGVYEFQWTS
jgi:hypothetical protein